MRIAEAVSKFVNEGADMILDELPQLGEPETDAINLVVNAAAWLAENPGGSFDQMIEECYDTTPDKVRAWWDWT